MTEFEKTYQNYNPRQAALDEARALLTAAAKAAMADGALPEAELPAFIVEIPADTKNGDIASNIAMAGARSWRKAPKMIADALLAHLPSIENSVFAKVEVAGPGFINLFLAPSFWASVVLGACSNKEYGRTDHGKGAKYNVEFVSANPTGPMHMGNARGGALGDCLSAVLDWSGYDVTREFYINDAGNQIQKFGKSLAVRYLQKYCGEEAYPLPAECYQGGDIKVLAGEFAEINGDQYVAACQGMDEETLFASDAFAQLKDALVAYALPKNIAALKRDLGKYRIDYDVWFHESTLHESGAVKAVVDKLLELGACYKAEDGAIMYRSAQYAAKYGTVNKKKTEDGTEEEAKDEVLVRANGIPTYFAADIAYHYNKLATRGFAKAIDVWGADHHGHVARMKGAMDAIGLNGEDLDVVLMQMVNLMRDGQPVRMSKRTGNAITLTDLLDHIEKADKEELFALAGKKGMELDIPEIPELMIDNTDRNRTSPFAFTGNRFEFRAVGSEANCASSLIVLNAAVAEALENFKTRVDALIAKGEDQTSAIIDIVREDIKTCKPIRFDGNGYSDEWKEEAQKRGLDCEASCPVVFDRYLDKESIEMFAKTNVMSESELKARNEVKWETYTKKIQIEARVMGDLSMNHIIPVATHYQSRLAKNVEGMIHIFGGEEGKKLTARNVKIIREIAERTEAIERGVEALVDARKVANKIESEREKAVAYHDTVAPKMEEIRYQIDKLELLVADELWTLPKYRELLFIR